MIRNLILSLIAVCGLSLSLCAQTDNRTRETKIADAIMLLPVDNSAHFSKLMNELYSLGNVIGELVPRLSDDGKDVQTRYAIAGLVTYSSQKQEYRTVIAGDLCKAIPSVKSNEILDFLLIQLQYVANDASTPTVSQYLGNPRLCDAAARVLVRIGSPAAGRALHEALKKATSVEQKATLVQSLGEINYSDALPEINALISSAEVKLKKVSLYALAQIASPESEKTLTEAVAKVGYLEEPTDALGAYFTYLNNRLVKNNDTKPTLAAGKRLIDATSDSKQLAAKTAAIKLYVRAARGNAEKKAVKEILAALKSANRQYRCAALAASLSLQQTAEVNKALTAQLKKEKNAEVKVDIINVLGFTGQADAQNTVTPVLDCVKDPNPNVKTAAIITFGKLSKTLAQNKIAPPANSLQQITAAMNTDNAEIVETGKNVLKSLKRDQLVETVAAALPQATNAAKIAFFDILASRKASEKFEDVYQHIISENASKEVRYAAAGAIGKLARETDAPLIAKALNTSSEKEMTKLLQNALYASVSGLPKEEQTKRITGLLKTGRNPSVYYNVYSQIGGSEALKFVLLGLESEASSEAAIEALTNWNDEAALPALFEIVKSKPKYSEQALVACISKIGKSKGNPEYKLILLRNALEATQNDVHKQKILSEIGHIHTFTALTTAGKYLDSRKPEIQQAAVQAVRTIALSNKNFYGKEVRELLNRAITLNTHPEASYQKEEILKHLATLPADDGFVAAFNGKDLTGWKGLVDNPIARSKMTPKQLAEKQKQADEVMRKGWVVEDNTLIFTGKGDNLCTEKQYGDFEMYVDWRLDPSGKDADAGIYLRGTPQVQIWDTARRNAGAQVGSGGLYNNQKNESKPLMVADNKLGDWNTFYIKMIGDKVTVYLNGCLVVDNVVLENYWDRKLPIFPTEQIELQAHGTRVEYRDIYIREIPRPEPYKVSAKEKAEGFVPLFNGIDMDGWIGNLKDYIARNGAIACVPVNGGHGNLYTAKEYADFVLRFEFKLTPAANNGLGIRTPTEGDAAYEGMELQILDNEADVYKNLAKYQYHGSVYGVIPAKRGYLKPTGEWNVQEVVANGNKIKVTLNGTVILDGDIAAASKNFTETIDKQKHSGLSNKKGHIGFLGHGSEVEFKNIRIKELKK
ncbi:MAG: DUF1080 domain-containing protein [Prevotellaceae bacterium]|jgi:hypothetical protein|nr:DUF1080 domain-containing protein [Prevotellaceae bacterium]